MDIHALISDIKNTLLDTFGRVDHWFEKTTLLHYYQPANGGWTIAQVLEHIGLTNHFLLILIEKGTQKALALSAKTEWEHALETYVFHKDQLTEVGIHQSFQWIRPDHMEPLGNKSMEAVRQQIKDQVGQCLSCLLQLKNGEGILYTTTMTVNGLGKIDVYQYLYFLIQHAQRHITQMEKNEMEYVQIAV